MIQRDEKLELLSPKAQPKGPSPVPRRTVLLEEDAAFMGFSRPNRSAGSLVFAWAPPKAGGPP